MEGGESGRRDEDSRQRAERREEEALGQELLDDTAAGRTQGLSHRHLAAAGRGSSEEEAGDVRAHDEQHGGDGEDQDDEGPARVSYELLAEGQHEGA